MVRQIIREQYPEDSVELVTLEQYRYAVDFVRLCYFGADGWQFHYYLVENSNCSHSVSESATTSATLPQRSAYGFWNYWLIVVG